MVRYCRTGITQRVRAPSPQGAIHSNTDDAAGSPTKHLSDQKRNRAKQSSQPIENKGVIRSMDDDFQADDDDDSSAEL